MKAKYLRSFAFSVSSFIWSAYGWYTDTYDVGLLVYALAYFVREIYSCLLKADYQYVFHGGLASAGIITAMVRGPEYYRYIYHMLSLFELSTPFLNIAKQYRTKLSYQTFAASFFAGRILIGTYMYITTWIYLSMYLSTGMMALQYYWMMQICLKAKELKGKAD